jgi:hypothetical protein
MQPIDARNMTWDQVCQSLRGMRERVYWYWMQLGPGTTEQVASRAECSILTLRPRTTELVALGLVRMIGLDNGQGIYEGVSIAEAQAAREPRPVHQETQMDLRIGA